MLMLRTRVNLLCHLNSLSFNIVLFLVKTCQLIHNTALHFMLSLCRNHSTFRQITLLRQNKFVSVRYQYILLLLSYKILDIGLFVLWFNFMQQGFMQVNTEL